MCHRMSNPSSLTHTHKCTHTLLRWRKRGNRGDRKKSGWKIEDGGSWGMREAGGRPTVCQLVSCPRVVTHTLPSVSANTLTVTHTHIHTHTEHPWMSSEPFIYPTCVCTGAHTRAHKDSNTHTGMTVRRMTGGSSHVTPSLGQTLIHQDVLDSSLCLSGKSQSETCVKKKKTR